MENEKLLIRMANKYVKRISSTVKLALFEVQYAGESKRCELHCNFISASEIGTIVIK